MPEGCAGKVIRGRFVVLVVFDVYWEGLTMLKNVRHAVSVVVAITTLSAAALSTIAVTPASAQSAAGCTSQGSMTITPGFTPVPQAESVAFNGTMTCAGVIDGAVYTPFTPFGFNGSMTGCTGSIEATICTNFAITAGPVSCSGGIALWWGYYHEWHCVIGPFAYWHWGAWIPNPINQGTDIQTANLDGADTMVGA